MIKADGFDNAILGVTALPDGTEVLVYDKRRCVQIIMFTLGFDYNESVGFFEFNIRVPGLGKSAPLYVEPYFEEDYDDEPMEKEN
jgi:hypothetical protein